MIKSVPDEMLRRHAKEMIDWIFDESGCHRLSMTLVEGVMDYSLIRDRMVSELESWLADETLKRIYRDNGGSLFGNDKDVPLKKEYDEDGHIIRQTIRTHLDKRMDYNLIMEELDSNRS